MHKKRTTKKPKDMKALGEKGGKATLRKKGRAFFRRIAKMRKTHGGGRPTKNPDGEAQV